MAIRRNVREQNDLTREAVRRTSAAFRNDMLSYPWLLTELTQRGLDPVNGLLAQLEQVPEPNGDLYQGYWLSDDRKFYYFEILVARRPRVSSEVEQWRDATTEVTVRSRQPGTGNSFGFIALEVLNEHK